MTAEKKLEKARAAYYAAVESWVAWKSCLDAVGDAKAVKGEKWARKKLDKARRAWDDAASDLDLKINKATTGEV